METIRVRLRRTITLQGSGRTREFSTDVSSSDQAVGIQQGQTQAISTSMPVPQAIQRTLRSVLIQCNYTATTQGVTGGCCVGNITGHVPVT